MTEMEMAERAYRIHRAEVTRAWSIDETGVGYTLRADDPSSPDGHYEGHCEPTSRVFVPDSEALVETYESRSRAAVAVFGVGGEKHLLTLDEILDPYTGRVIDARYGTTRTERTDDEVVEDWEAAICGADED